MDYLAFFDLMRNNKNMKNNEVEIVKYPRIKHIRMLVNAICYKEDHIHNDFEIAYLLRGNAILEINGVSHDLKPGDIEYEKESPTDESKYE